MSGWRGSCPISAWCWWRGRRRIGSTGASSIGFALLLETLCIGAFAVWSGVAAPSAEPVYLLLLVTRRGAGFLVAGAVGDAAEPGERRGISARRRRRLVAVPALLARSARRSAASSMRSSGPGMFAVAAALYLVALTQARRLAPAGRVGPRAERAPTDESVLGGIRYIRANRLLLALISLDLFAVLLGGVTALLPIYRQGHSGGRAGGARPLALRARHRRGDRRAVPGAPLDPARRRPADAGLRRRVRRRDGRLRCVERISGCRSARWRWRAGSTWSAW